MLGQALCACLSTEDASPACWRLGGLQSRRSSHAAAGMDHYLRTAAACIVSIVQIFSQTLWEMIGLCGHPRGQPHGLLFTKLCRLPPPLWGIEGKGPPQPSPPPRTHPLAAPTPVWQCSHHSALVMPWGLPVTFSTPFSSTLRSVPFSGPQPWLTDKVLWEHVNSTAPNLTMDRHTELGFLEGGTGNIWHVLRECQWFIYSSFSDIFSTLVAG